MIKADRQIIEYCGDIARLSTSPDKTLTVEVKSKQQGEKLLTMKILNGESIEVSNHEMYNKSEGVITCDLLKSYTDEDIVDGLSHLGVIKAYRIKKRNQDGDLMPTSTLVLTFNKSTPPDRIRIISGLTERVRPYIPLPKRCYKCQQYGHVAKTCRQTVTICGRCSEECNEEHITEKFNKPVLCFHCRESHCTS